MCSQKYMLVSFSHLRLSFTIHIFQNTPLLGIKNPLTPKAEIVISHLHIVPKCGFYFLEGDN